MYIKVNRKDDMERILIRVQVIKRANDNKWIIVKPCDEDKYPSLEQSMWVKTDAEVLTEPM